MDLEKAHNIVRFYLRKATDSWFSPEEIDGALNRGQIEFFDEIKPGFGVNQQLNDALRPFRKKLTLTSGNTTAGVVTLPTDYQHLLVISVALIDAEGHNRYYPVEMVNDDELDTRRDSQLCPVTAHNPVGVFDPSGTIQVYPDTTFAGYLRYLKKPVDCQFVYSQSGRTITYNSGSSVQLEWNEPSTQQIILKAVGILGLNSQDIAAINYTQAKTAG
jgi:hypothetical protein